MGLGATYAVNRKLTGKLLADFLLVIIEFLSLAVMAEVLRANIDWKSPFKGWVNLVQNSHQLDNVLR